MGMEIIGLSLLFFAIFVIWVPYHLAYGRKRHKSAEKSLFEFIDYLFIAIICIGVPLIWPFLILALFDKPKHSSYRAIGHPVDLTSHRLRAEGKNWL